MIQKGKRDEHCKCATENAQHSTTTHYTGQKEQGNAEQHFVDENEINEALSENLFKNTKHDLYPHPHATF